MSATLQCEPSPPGQAGAADGMAIAQGFARKAASAGDPVQVAASLRALLSKHAEACEREGCMQPEVIEALYQAGLFHITAPRRAGGRGETVWNHVRTVAELAKACPGSAWAYGLLSGITGTALGLPDAQRHLLFRTGRELFCSATARTGIATPVDGGYRISGGWGYGSGCLQASWALNGAVFHDTDGNCVDRGLAFIDLAADDVRIVNDWRVAGLAGSGSNRIEAEHHFVPHALVLRNGDAPDPAMLYQMPGLEPRDFWPWEPLFPLGVLGPLPGAAEGLLELVRDAMESRPVVGWSHARQSDSQLLVARLGEAAMAIDSAWMHIRRACDLLDVIAPQRLVTPFEKARAQADCGHAMRLLREAGNLLMDIAGPAGFALANPMQRLWRDLNMGTRHNALNADLSLELYGRAMLGQASSLDLLPDVAPGPGEPIR
jgi:alkylation response protein AidB-like acyl-CoA dehydrogenase